MSTKCQNCQTTLTCGCQKRIASDNRNVCSNCAAAYEAKIKSNIVINNPIPLNTTPSNVTLIYNGRI